MDWFHQSDELRDVVPIKVQQITQGGSVHLGQLLMRLAYQGLELRSHQSPETT